MLEVRFCNLSSTRRVTLCRDARSVRPLSNDKTCNTVTFNGDGRTIRVTLCRDARSVRPLYQRLQRRGFNGDGRTDRASLQRVTRETYRV